MPSHVDAGCVFSGATEAHKPGGWRTRSLCSSPSLREKLASQLLLLGRCIPGCGTRQIGGRAVQRTVAFDRCVNDSKCNRQEQGGEAASMEWQRG